MFRMAVSIYLIFAIAAGPAALCCCWFKSVSATAGSVSSGPVTPSQEGGCPLCKKHDGELPVPEKAPNNEPCPCKKNNSCFSLSSVVPDEARLWTLDSPISLIALDALGLRCNEVASLPRPSAPVGLRDGPWLTTSDLLTTHHVIRC